MEGLMILLALAFIATSVTEFRRNPPNRSRAWPLLIVGLGFLAFASYSLMTGHR